MAGTVTADTLDAAVLASALPLACMNCEAPLSGSYCAACGQEARIETPTVGEFLREFLQDQMALEGKLLRTLKMLVGRPGQLTLDYIAGRRQRYLRPLRLYLTLSVVYFAVAGLSGGAPSLPDADDAAPDAKQESTATPAPAPPKPAADQTPKAPAKGTFDCKNVAACINLDDENAARKFKLGYAPLDGRIQRFLKRAPKDASEDFSSALRNDAPVAVFFVLPLFAGLLKLGYLRHHLRYGVHVLFSLHVHAFVFFDLLLASIPWPGIVDFALYLAIPAYLLLALRRVYGGGLWSTGFWVAGTLLLYAIFIGIALMVAAVVSVTMHA